MKKGNRWLSRLLILAILLLGASSGNVFASSGKVIVDDDLIKITEVDEQNHLYAYEIKDKHKFQLVTNLASKISYEDIFLNARANVRDLVIEKYPCLKNTNFSKELDQQTENFLKTTEMAFYYLRSIYLNFPEDQVIKCLDYANSQAGEKFINEFKHAPTDANGRLRLNIDENSAEQNMIARMIFGFHQEIALKDDRFKREGQKLNQAFKDLQAKYITRENNCDEVK